MEQTIKNGLSRSTKHKKKFRVQIVRGKKNVGHL